MNFCMGREKIRGQPHGIASWQPAVSHKESGGAALIFVA